MGLMALSMVGHNEVLTNYIAFDEQMRLLRGTLATVE